MIKKILGFNLQSALTKWRSFFVLGSFALLCVVIGWLTYAYYVYSNPYNPTQKEITIIKGSSTLDALFLLYKEKILPHPYLTITFAIFMRSPFKFVAGEYLFPTNAPPKQIFKILRMGQVLEHKFVFPEGLTTHEIVTSINNDPRLSGALNIKIPEGSLFPSTYKLQRNSDRMQLIKVMQDNMNKLAKELMKTNQNPFIKTEEQLITFASILEKEAAIPEELPRIAGVFVNRLKNHMRLQSCPTVIYAKTLGKTKTSNILTYEDLKIESEYNTYKKNGLPIGPICCPGLNALKAAAYPMNTTELFFVFDGKQHHFSVTYKEHLNRKNLIKKRSKDSR
ncbi:MAG: endolytic transglycosylase MltG [Candidatus Paracaedibacteraceae bacterium]|nr:endolytic transglycosylase MltG [Candidatus Paracaedibacteraceae bacterium]